MTLKRKRRLEISLAALRRIREMGYNSQACMATETVLACIRVAEEALREAGEGR